MQPFTIADTTIVARPRMADTTGSQEQRRDVDGGQCRVSSFPFRPESRHQHHLSQMEDKFERLCDIIDNTLALLNDDEDTNTMQLQ